MAASRRVRIPRFWLEATPDGQKFCPNPFRISSREAGLPGESFLHKSTTTRSLVGISKPSGERSPGEGDQEARALIQF